MKKEEIIDRVYIMKLKLLETARHMPRDGNPANWIIEDIFQLVQDILQQEIK